MFIHSKTKTKKYNNEIVTISLSHLTYYKGTEK